MNDFKNYDDFAAYIAREFFKKNGVNRYRLLKTDEMSNDQVVKACQLYCEENNLLHEYSVFLEQAEALQTGKQYLGKVIDVAVDRPLGSRHPKHSDIVYPVNYGYCEFMPRTANRRIFTYSAYTNRFPLSGAGLLPLYADLTILKINGWFAPTNTHLPKRTSQRQPIFRKNISKRKY